MYTVSGFLLIASLLAAQHARCDDIPPKASTLLAKAREFLPHRAKPWERRRVWPLLKDFELENAEKHLGLAQQHSKRLLDASHDAMLADTDAELIHTLNLQPPVQGRISLAVADGKLIDTYEALQRHLQIEKSKKEGEHTDEMNRLKRTKRLNVLKPGRASALKVYRNPPPEWSPRLYNTREERLRLVQQDAYRDLLQRQALERARIVNVQKYTHKENAQQARNVYETLSSVVGEAPPWTQRRQRRERQSLADEHAAQTEHMKRHGPMRLPNTLQNQMQLIPDGRLPAEVRQMV